ncbi:MAG TPA: RNA polymerase sigma factor [Gaiellaceae bacterium]|nr:RNA polymerase sigma factor [Gaiellaceae bacterium]
MKTVETVFREEWGRVLATLIGVLGDFELAEDALQDAVATAVERWPRDGMPDNPGAWLTATARNRAIDRIRREQTLARKTELLQRLAELETDEDPDEPVPDDRLSLIFTCCHPALAPEAQVALTLRAVGGLTTTEIARAFLVPETTMGQRLVRAKRKIRDAGVPFRVPPEHLLPERLDAVLAVLYLVFNEGYVGTSAGRLVRGDLCEEAIRLAKLLAILMPDELEVLGLLALMLFHDSRRAARIAPDGTLILLEDQDRALWNRDRIAEGDRVLSRVRGIGPYRIQARIAAVHAHAVEPAETDWRRIVELYDDLVALAPSPVVELNRAAAIAMAEGPDRGLSLIDRIEGLDDYYLLHAARADLLRRDGRDDEAAAAYRRALELATNPVERSYFERRLAEVG